MLFSKTFLFIHIDKSAGTSIQRALRPYACPVIDSRLRRRLTWLGKANRLGLHRFIQYPEHVTARTVKNCLPPAVYDGVFKFAFVRNPWDRLVSRYAQLLRNPEEPGRHASRAKSGFEEFLQWEIQRNKSHQHTFVCDVNGDLIVDFIGHYERLEEGFANVCHQLGLSATLPKTNVSLHENYQTYYTPATRQLIAEHFRRDIELFGYTFDRAPAGAIPVAK